MLNRTDASGIYGKVRQDQTLNYLVITQLGRTLQVDRACDTLQ